MNRKERYRKYAWFHEMTTDLLKEANVYFDAVNANDAQSLKEFDEFNSIMWHMNNAKIKFAELKRMTR